MSKVNRAGIWRQESGGWIPENRFVLGGAALLQEIGQRHAEQVVGSAQVLGDKTENPGTKPSGRQAVPPPQAHGKGPKRKAGPH